MRRLPGWTTFWLAFAVCQALGYAFASPTLGIITGLLLGYCSHIMFDQAPKAKEGK